ncbi:MAG: hypothetical protein ABW200_11215 [Hyphomicrobiaceae bacterium]
MVEDAVPHHQLTIGRRATNAPHTDNLTAAMPGCARLLGPYEQTSAPENSLKGGEWRIVGHFSHD